MQASQGEVLASARRLILAAAVSALSWTVGAGPAGAQSGIDLNTENVTVDLSVIGQSHRPVQPGVASTAPIASQSGGGLLVPGPSNPSSQLHVMVPYGPGSVVKLRPPSEAKRTVATTPARKSSPVKAPASSKPAKPPMAAIEPPAPLTAAPPPPAVIAAPVTPTTKSELPPMAGAEAAKKKDEAASKVAAAPSTTAPAPAAAKSEQASTSPTSGDAKETRALQVIFPTDVSKLPNESKDGLSLLAKKLKDNETMRLQLLAYAGGKDLTASKARRLSLSRALSVRSYLIENGIRSTRIDVRALGDKVPDEPVNRVDVNIVER